MIQRAMASSFLAIMLAACSISHADLSREAAVAAARKHVGDPVDAVVSAVWAPTLPDGRNPDPPDRGIWTVEFRASFERPCGPPPGNVCRVDRIVIRIGSTTGNDYGRDEEGRTIP